MAREILVSDCTVVSNVVKAGDTNIKSRSISQALLTDITACVYSILHSLNKLGACYIGFPNINTVRD